jgi:hypothetical protein
MKKLWARFGSDIVVVLLLALLCVLFYWRVITPFAGDRGYFPSGDFSDQFYVFGVFEARQLLTGNLPFWNPYTYGGHPFLADIQAAIFYPLSLITIFLSSAWKFPIYALEMEAIFHFFLGGLFTYIFAKRLLKRPFPAFVAALTFTYGGYLTSYPVQQLAILEVNVWLPLILLLLSIAWERWQKRSEKGFVVWAGLVLGISFLAGHPQSSMYIVYVSILYWVFETWKGGDKLWPKVGLYCLFLLTGLGVAAVQLVPSVEYMLLSTRAEGTYAEMAHGFPLHDLLQIFLPGVLSQWSPLYVGILPLLLAFLGVYLIRDRRVLFWAVLALLALLLSLGGNTFLYSPFYLWAPGFGIFRSQERAAYVFSFAVAMLAGYGASQLFHSLPRPTRKQLRAFNWGLALGALASFMLVFFFLYGWLRAGLAANSPFGPVLNRAILLVIFLLFSVGCIHARLRRLAGMRLLMVVTGLVIIFDLFTVNWQNNFQATNPQEEYGPRPLLAPIQADKGTFRVYNEWRLPGNYGMIYELKDIGGASPLRLRWYDELVDALPPERLWELLNVKYVVTWRGALLPPTELVYEEPTAEDITYLHRLGDYLPRAYVVHQAQILKDEEALELLADPGFDPLETVILEEEPDLALTDMPPAGSTVSVGEYEPTRIVLEIEAAADGILVLSETYYPGWRAYVDGQGTKIYRADYALRAVSLEAGSHRVELVYDPLSFRVGFVISAIALIAVAGTAVRGAFRIREYSYS